MINVLKPLIAVTLLVGLVVLLQLYNFSIPIIISIITGLSFILYYLYDEPKKILIKTSNDDHKNKENPTELQNNSIKKYKKILIGILYKLNDTNTPYYEELYTIYNKYNACQLNRPDLEEMTARCLAEYTVLMIKYNEPIEPPEIIF